jgi:hypothetical protein
MSLLARKDRRSSHMSAGWLGSLNFVTRIHGSQCKAQAAEKLAQAEREPRHRRKLQNAAKAWLILASKIEDEPKE